MADDFEQEEYFTVAKAVADFDQRLLTVKSWGVTLSLVALGAGFQYRAYGYFLVAAASSLAFWIVEAAVKRHQMRHYYRMREIEVNRFVAAGPATGPISFPRIDWSWQEAATVANGERTRTDSARPEYRGASLSYRWAWTLPHVALPHAVTLILGLGLFVLGCLGHLDGFALGATPGKG